MKKERLVEHMLPAPEIEDVVAPSEPGLRHQAVSLLGYSVVVANLVADRPCVLSLWRDNPSQPASAASKYRWLYVDNPYPSATQLLLCSGSQGDRVGVAGMVTRQFVARGVVLSAGQLIDFYVQPPHRTFYPALLLQREMRAVGLGIHDLLYGYPNDSSRQLVQRIGYVEIGKLTRFVALLRCGEYLGKWLPQRLGYAVGLVVDSLLRACFRPHRLLFGSWRGEWADEIDDRFDSLWDRAKRFDGIIGVRDRRFLSWRFFERPNQKYRLFTLSEGQCSGIAAYAVCDAEGDTLHIRDMLFDPTAPEQICILIHLLKRQAAMKDFVRLSFECLASEQLRHLLRAVGMFERGKMPIVATLRTGIAASLQGLAWYITCADTDV